MPTEYAIALGVVGGVLLTLAFGACVSWLAYVFGDPLDEEAEAERTLCRDRAYEALRAAVRAWRDERRWELERCLAEGERVLAEAGQMKEGKP